MTTTPANFRFGGVTTTGRRPTNEDAHVITPILNKINGTFIAVYDGHGGASAACYSSTALHTVFQNQKSYPEHIKKSLELAFQITDKNYIKYENSADIFSSAGCTACVAFITEYLITVANAGDARFVLQRQGEIRQISKDHKPSVPSERYRIEYYGSCVVEIPGDCPRIAGMLAVSRAIGDAPFKGCGVISVPELFEERLDGVDFVVLACDGLWDVLSNEEVYIVVQTVFNRLPQGKILNQREDALVRGVYKLLESQNFRDQAVRDAESIIRTIADNQDFGYDQNDLNCQIRNDKERFSPTHCARILAKVAVAAGSEDNVSVVVGIDRTWAHID